MAPCLASEVVDDRANDQAADGRQQDDVRGSEDEAQARRHPIAREVGDGVEDPDEPDRAETGQDSHGHREDDELVLLGQEGRAARLLTSWSQF